MEIRANSLKILLSIRSSVGSRTEALTDRITAIATLSGADVSYSNGYPAWQPDVDSGLLRKSMKVYEELFGEKAGVLIIHAGLECGVIGEKYPESGTITGKVVNIMPYGVFVELEKGIEGLIHISEFSWSKKYNHPNEKFSLGDEVTAMVLKVDKDNQKLSLGIKQLEEDPWQGVEDKFTVGDKIKGTVTALADYGAFIGLDNGIEGLVHVSDLSWTKRVTHPKDVLNKGDELEAVILSVDEQNRRIALGVKQLTQDPWDDIVSKYEAGTEAEGPCRQNQDMESNNDQTSAREYAPKKTEAKATSATNHRVPLHESCVDWR